VPARGNLLLVALALAALAAPAAGQVPAPRLVEDGDDVAEEQSARPPLHEDPPPLPALPAPPPGAAAPAVSPGAAAPAPDPAPAATAASPGSAPAAGSAPLPVASELARRIVPVQASQARIMELWRERRTALREADPAGAEAAGEALLAARRELAIGNLFALAAVEVRESRRALRSNLPADAVAHARVAVELAPDLSDAHLALARARIAEAPGSPGPALAAIGDALAAAGREPHTVRAFQGDLSSAAFAAVFVAALATVLLLVVRRLRLFLHDFHHLPLLRGTAPVQASFLAVVLLGMPFALGLGPVAAAALALLAVWLYLATGERLVATAAVAALVALPWGAGAVARGTAWTGSLAETVHALEHGAVPDEEVAALEARFAAGPVPAAVHAAVGRHHKRRGDLDAAQRAYELAATADPRAAEVQVNLGNVLFLKGDLEGAKAAYLAATDRAAGDLVVLGAAHYDLSKLYLRTSDMPQSAAAREKAEREAGEFLRLHGADDDFAANRWLVDVPVPDEKIRALAGSDGTPDAVAAWVERRLAGDLPRALWPWGPLAWLGALWALALAAPRLRPARACERCGGAACRRCEASAGELCGQCMNVFVRRGVVDARDRLRKEAQVRRRLQLVNVTTRILSVVAGGAAQVFHGAAARGALLLAGVLFAAFVVWFWRGIMPPPQPSPYVLAGKLAVAAPLGIALWAFAIRDAFRRTKP
jgi:tetratricopeptide (TPR) repeat protein